MSLLGNATYNAHALFFFFATQHEIYLVFAAKASFYNVLQFAYN